jgi:ATP-dependent protease Clp ATPase subunit
MALPEFVRVHGGSCSFCKTSSAGTHGLVSATGKDHRVCSACIERCVKVLGQGPEEVAAIREDLVRATAAGDAGAIAALQRTLDVGDRPHDVLPNGIACSFCDRVVTNRRQIVAAPTLYICDACVTAAAAVLDA